MVRAEAAELYKDKIEVSLDGRQIFYLFFGGAVIVGLVFVLGVMVGRRVEARGHVERAQTSATVDPLAALDRLEGSRGLSFQGALTGGDAAPNAVEATIAAQAEARKSAVPTPVKSEDDEPTPEPTPEPKPEAAKVEAPKPEPKAETKPESKGPVTKPDAEAKADSPEAIVQKFTLQLSSFQNKADAEQFLSSVKASGYQAQLSQAEVSGKGTFYRIRMGTYRSLEAAIDAKSDYEKTSSKTASIMKL